MRKNTTYTVPSGVKVIDEYAFAGANIKNVTISSKVSRIGKNAFENCKSLKKVQGEFNTSELPENMFYDCTKLNYFVIPDLSLIHIYVSVHKPAFEKIWLTSS